MNKQVLTCRPSWFVRRLLRRIRVVLRYIPRRNQSMVPALMQMQKCPTSGPNLTRGHIRTIIHQAMPTLLAPRGRHRLYGARTQGTTWTWMFQLKCRNLTSLLPNNNDTFLHIHLRCGNKRRPRLNKRKTNGRGLRRKSKPLPLSLQDPTPTRGRTMTRT